MRIPRTLVSILVTLLLILQGMPVAVLAAVDPNVISLNADMNFGTPALSGGVYTYANVVTKSGITVDAKVTIEEQVNASIGRFDDSTQFTERFNPAISVPNNGEGYVRYRINFVNQATGEPVLLKDFYVTGVNLDGATAYTEFTELSGFETYTVDRDTKLTVVPGGRTRFVGMNATEPGLIFSNDSAFIANYTAPISSMDLVLGITDKQTTARLFSVKFGLPGGVFSNPRVNPNAASPFISVAIDDGDGMLTAAADDLSSVTIYGNTDAGFGQIVTLEVSPTTGSPIYLSAEVYGDAYSVQANMLGLADGPITVTASVVDPAGNPASPATAQTTKSTGTSTTVACLPDETNVGAQVTCAATVTDDYPEWGVSPDGTVSFTDDGTGSFTGTTCTLVDGSCSVTYTPGRPSGGLAISGQYDGGLQRQTSSGGDTISVLDGLTLTAGQTALYANATTQLAASGGAGVYTYDVITNESGATVTSAGLYTAGLKGGVTDTVRVTDTGGAEATIHLDVNKRPTSTEVTCAPSTLALGNATTCTATVTDTGGAGALTPVGSVTFSTGGDCTLQSGLAWCSVMYTPSSEGAHTVLAAFSGSQSHEPNNSTDPGGSNATLTVMPSLAISPKVVEVPVFGELTFTATGGVGAHTFSILEGASAGNGTLSGETYTAGDQVGNTVTVRVKDTMGNTDDAVVTLVRRAVSVTLSCLPNPVHLGAEVACTATLADAENGTQQPLDPENFTIIPFPDLIDNVQCIGMTTLTCTFAFTPSVDGALTLLVGYDATPVHSAAEGWDRVTVYGLLTLGAPSGSVYVKGSGTFAAQGGAGGYVYSIETDNSGGAVIGASDGEYTAGLKGGVTDTVTVRDADGYTTTATITVNKRPTKTEVTCTPGALIIGGSSTCTATVADTSGEPVAVTVTGQVTFQSNADGAFSSGAACTLDSGSCTVTYTPGRHGSHEITATYPGSDLHLASSSSTAGGSGDTLTVDKRSISITVDCDPNPANLGEPSTCTVTVTDPEDPAQVPSGDVTWADASNGIFDRNECTLDANGQCTVTYTPTQVGSGTHYVHAVYPGTVTRKGGPATDILTVRASSLAGAVTTGAGDVVVGMRLYLVNGAGQTLASTLTDAGGGYSFSGLMGGTYTVKVMSETAPLAQETKALPAASDETVNIVLPTTATLTLTADPQTIVGDGKKVSRLTALLTAEGAPLTGVSLTFAATDGTLFDLAAATDADGIASAKLRAPQITGVNNVLRKASVKVHDVDRGLFAFEELVITFAPASVDGLVMDNSNPRKPIPGAIVRITDGGSFEAESVTDAEGRYSIVVPNGKTTYTVEITAEVEVALPDPNAQGGFRMVRRTVTTTQTATLDDLSGTGEALPAANTVGGQLFAPDKKGGVTGIDETLLSGLTLVGSLRLAGTNTILPNKVTIQPDGSFRVEDVPVGTYDLLFQVQAPPPGNELLALSVVSVTVSEEGELTFGFGLVDPFGIVTEEGNPTRLIHGATVDLRWANTQRNIDLGRTPGAQVALPVLPDFDPNQNRVTQLTTAAGEYAFMVFPHGDYIVVATHPNYERHESPIITVEEEIVEYNFSMKRLPDPGNGGGPGPTTPPPPPAPLKTEVWGLVVDAATGRPMRGAQVTLLTDTVETGTDGSYKFTVTARNQTYTARVTAPVQVQGKSHTLTATQSIAVSAGNQPAISVPAQGKIAGQLFLVLLGGGEPMALTADQAQNVRATLKASSGTERSVSISPTGYFEVENVAPGTYTLVFQAEGADGRLLLLSQVPVSVTKEGQLSLLGVVVEPWGMVRDDETPAPIGNVEVEVLERHIRYIGGYPDGTFQPENAVTRAEAAVVFARIIGADLTLVTPAVMTDVDDTHWASRHIAVVMRAGLFKGYADGSFGPNKPMTRAELAVVIARYKGLSAETRSLFQDTTGHWAEPFITAIFDAGIARGYADNTFGPELTARRSELVTMINRMLGRGPLMTGRAQPRWPDVPFTHWAVGQIEEASISHTSRLGADQMGNLVEEFVDEIE